MRPFAAGERNPPIVRQLQRHVRLTAPRCVGAPPYPHTDRAETERLRQQSAVGIDSDVAEGIEAESRVGVEFIGRKLTLPTAYHHSVNA